MQKRQPVSEDFGETQPKIFSTFVKYLNDNETRHLKCSQYQIHGIETCSTH